MLRYENGMHDLAWVWGEVLATIIHNETFILNC